MKKTKIAKKAGKRGGPQPGSGRPRLSAQGTVLFAGSVPAELAAQVEARRQRAGLSRSAALRAALEAWLR